MSGTNYPRIYLAIDNCFASKRWTIPAEWGRIIKDMGLKYIEASADNECEPFYNGSEYIADWTDKVRQIEEELEIKVANLYSGHGTYATLGLAHNDPRVRDRMLNKWLKCMVDTASSLNAGLGFFCHAFDQNVLQNPQEYLQKLELLYEDLAHLAEYTVHKKILASIEQMYTPHQIPWTINGAYDLLKQVYQRSKCPFYLTIDVGHQCYQQFYQRPGREKIKEYLEKFRAGQRVKRMWLGPDSAYRIFNEMLASATNHESINIEKIIDITNQYYYLFAEAQDGDPYKWLSRLGCWSPIIHLQQTDGTVSSHKPFSSEYNKKGIIDGTKVLNAIAKSYEHSVSESMPPLCKDIYLTIEVFSGTGEMPSDIVAFLNETVKYWRQFVPLDGMSLDKLLNTRENSSIKKTILAIDTQQKNKARNISADHQNANASKC